MDYTKLFEWMTEKMEKLSAWRFILIWSVAAAFAAASVINALAAFAK